MACALGDLTVSDLQGCLASHTPTEYEAHSSLIWENCRGVTSEQPRWQVIFEVDQVPGWAAGAHPRQTASPVDAGPLHPPPLVLMAGVRAFREEGGLRFPGGNL